MILRRFMQHVKEQNWFAVGLDVIVVIVGIFLGLQVQAWYGDIEEREQERLYLNRLHTEALQSLNFTGDNFEGVRLLDEFTDAEKNINEAIEVIFGRDTETVLGEHHCASIYTSNIFNDQQTYLPTLEEMIASGQLVLIHNEAIKIALSEYTFSFNALKQMVAQLNRESNIMAKDHRDLYSSDGRLRNILAFNEFEMECDFEAMKQDHDFKEALASNIANLYYFNFTFANQQKSLENLHVLLDQELGITH